MTNTDYNQTNISISTPTKITRILIHLSLFKLGKFLKSHVKEQNLRYNERRRDLPTLTCRQTEEAWAYYPLIYALKISFYIWIGNYLKRLDLKLHTRTFLFNNMKYFLIHDIYICVCVCHCKLKWLRSTRCNHFSDVWTFFF